MTWKRKIPGEGACGPCCSWKEKFDQLWDRAIGCITKINNITPDGDGKFEIRGGTGVQVTPISNGVEINNTGAVPQDAIETINSINPDADKNFEITAGTNISIDDDATGITINCDVPAVELAAVDPIVIDDDGKIAMGDWTEDTSLDWSIYITNGKTNKDLLFKGAEAADAYGVRGSFYVPKGTEVSNTNNSTSKPWFDVVLYGNYSYFNAIRTFGFRLIDLLKTYSSTNERIRTVCFGLNLSDGYAENNTRGYVTIDNDKDIGTNTYKSAYRNAIKLYYR